jgi:hypothetical protein
MQTARIRELVKWEEIITTIRQRMALMDMLGKFENKNIFIK